jgi:FkbM family methyltransferase
MMWGRFRGAERVRLRGLVPEKIVEPLARKEIAPLLRFYPTQRDLVVFDIGAHKGFWTRALLDRFGERIGHVYLFEPSRENVRELTNREDNFAGLEPADFRRLSIERCAMGGRSGTATLYTNEDGSPLASLYPHRDAGWGPQMKDIRLSEQFEVPLQTIDSFLARQPLPRVDVVKIDTEGHEMEVLLGAEQSIAAGKLEVITFEFGVHQVESRHFFKDFWRYLTPRGYRLYFVEDDAGLTALERYEYRWERFNRNWVFIASRHLASPLGP